MGSQQNGAASEVNMPTTRGLDIALDQNGSALSGSLCDSNIDTLRNGGDKANGDVKSPASIPNVYAEDVVRSKMSNVIGIVTEVAGDLDSDSGITDDDDDDDNDDDDEDDDEDEDNAEDEERNVHDKSRDNHDENEGADKSGPLSAEQVRVLWINGTETTENHSDLTLTDRGFLHGDYVAAASDPTGQLGVVVDVNIMVDLSAPDGSSIENISSRDLKRVRDFTVGDYVVLGPWLGRIDDVLDNVTVKVDDGSVCKVVKADPLRLRPVTKNLLEDGHCPYYPGQRVRATSSSIFKNSRWLSGLWKATKLEGTVIKVTVGSVFVYWIASAGYGPNSSTAPAEEQSPKNLKLLSCFAYANWQLGDWCLLQSSQQESSIPLHKRLSKLKIDDSAKGEEDSSQPGTGCDSEEVECDENEFMDDPMAPSDVNNVNTASSECSSCGSSLSSVKEPVHESRPIHRKRIRKVVVKRDKKTRKKEDNFERALQIVNTRTKVDVLWQDGTIEHGLDSAKLIPIETPGDHDFVAEQYVVEKAADDEDYAGEPRRVGVVRSVNAKERTACVNWLKPVAKAEDPREFDKEEIVSVYELEGHPDYDYCYGDVVVRLSTMTSRTMASGDSVETPKQLNESNEENVNMEESNNAKKVSGDEGCADFSDFSWVGNISGLKNGDIEVTWADGMVSTVGPQAIYVVGRDDDDGSLADGSGLSDVASWETVEDDEMDTHEQEQEEQGQQSGWDADSNIESAEDNSGRNSALSLPFVALGFVTRLATGIFSRGRKNADSTELDPEAENHVQSEPLIKNSEDRCSSDEANSEKSNVLFVADSETTDQSREKCVSADLIYARESLNSMRSQDSIPPPTNEDDGSTFKHFDISRDPFDHYFLGTNAQSNNPRKWFRKVHQDWDILQNNLPDDIYVRVYEDRMDLLRAVIVGAYGTPYQDGLFFFDFHLPPEYPDVPPLAYYHSGGWRINPNLYEEGKVCLSLLNTWTGKGNEVWDPSSSSILQVLVSLQGLVLNAKPYFNEAGYDKQIGTAEGEKNSLSYNENTFLLNCKMMMNLMRRPPKDFDPLIKEHFKKRGFYILRACDAYKKGYLIGSLAKDASTVDDESHANSTSIGFKLMLGKIVPKLLLSLEEIGVDCCEFEHLRNS
ncbi:probable ubiquitin-conjugating enzyme E2 23 [Punica granatum]|uniref:E2 ubiquitin-conjugating enzyme n=1 Tax=Punica granatum TaxID=22663 RepID=A0A6P8CIW9_PUNGR|nr:probable ubiquitin-conjugating enzyme E2 23 [Punica granatum]